MKNEMAKLNGRRLEIFSKENLGSVRTVLDDKGEPWFCLKDICDILGLSDTNKVSSRLNHIGTNSIRVGVQTGFKKDGTPAVQEVPMIFIDEGNLYQTIMGSRKPQAKKFADWVTREVIPSIRKYGFYSEGRMSSREVYEFSKSIVSIYEENERLKMIVEENRNDINNLKKATMVFSFDDTGIENLIRWMKEKGIVNENLFPNESEEYDGVFRTLDIDNKRDKYGNRYCKLLLYVTEYGVDLLKDLLKKEGYKEDNINLEGYQKGIETLSYIIK